MSYNSLMQKDDDTSDPEEDASNLEVLASDEPHGPQELSQSILPESCWQVQSDCEPSAPLTSKTVARPSRV